jgi:type III secretion protein R
MNGLPDPITAAALIAAFGIAPFVALMMTSYTKLVIVFGLLRTALGLQQTPPNMVLNGIAIILTIHIMAPVGMEIGDQLKNHSFGVQGQALNDVETVLTAAEKPMKDFLQKHTREREKLFFMQTAKKIWPPERVQDLKSDNLLVLVPGFTLSELTRAFQIGFILYLVFVVVDLIVATILLALGMSMISPTTISLPFKLLLFVTLNGWTQLIQSLLMSY